MTAGRLVTGVLFAFCMVFGACVGEEKGVPAPTGEKTINRDAMQRLQGIWIDAATNTVFFRIQGDSIFYPDTVNIPVRFEIRSDTFSLIGGQKVNYPVDRLTDNLFYFHSSTGDIVRLKRSCDENDTLYFMHRQTVPIIYNEVVKRDTVVFLNGERYRCYVYVNPSKHKVYKRSYTDEGIAVENVYYDNVIHICVYKGKSCLYSRDYLRSSFQHIVPEDFLRQAILSDMHFMHVDYEGFHFYATVSIPDGASAYMADICISEKGEESVSLIQ